MTDKLAEALARAEQAEAQLAETKAELDILREVHRMVQSALLSQSAETERAEAERDAMRLRFQQIEYMPYSMVNDSESLRHTIKTLQGIARAALAPSPAGRED